MRVNSLVLMLLGVSLVACESKAPRVEVHQREIFVQGDPMDLVAGATFSPRSRLDENNIRKLEDYQLSSVLIFTEKSKVEKKPTTQRDLEEENKATDRSKLTRQSSKQDVKVGRSSLGLYSIQLLDGRVSFVLKPDANDRLQIFQVQAGGDSASVDPLHWSISPDGRLMSFLGRFDDQTSGRTLVAFYLEQKGPIQIIPKTDERFIYIFGPGQVMPLRHEGEIAVTMCGASTFSSGIKRAVEAWNKALDGHATIVVETPKTYPPFTDVNTRCIRASDTYLQEANDDILVYGKTFTLMSTQSGHIEDADVIIFKNEIQKLNRYGDRNGISRSRVETRVNHVTAVTLAHEIGHLLGLDHQFDEKTPSVMSYDFEHVDPTDYDIQAIRHLYKGQKIACGSGNGSLDCARRSVR